MNAPFNTRRPCALRFDRVAITCVFGDPRDLRRGPERRRICAKALERLGVAVEGIRPRMGRLGEVGVAACDMIAGLGRPVSSEQVLRGLRSRRRLAAQVAEQARADRRAPRAAYRHLRPAGLRPAPRRRSITSTATIAGRWRGPIMSMPAATTSAPWRRSSRPNASRCSGLAHVFTFGAYVRDNLIAHYGLPPEQVTAVGSGMGAIEPYDGPKSYDRPALLFVAKHLFQAKGGLLLLEAFDAGASPPAGPHASPSSATSAAAPSSATGPASPSTPICPGRRCSSSIANRRCWFSRC